MDATPNRPTQSSNELICHCAGVDRSTIKSAIARAPVSTLETLGQQLGCGVQCGCCRPLVQEMLGLSPWRDVVQATRTVMTTSAADRRVVQIDLQLGEDVTYPQAQPAQHVVFQAQLDGEWVTRTYTVIDQSEDGRRITIAMRRIAGGRLSTTLLDADDATFAATPLRIAIPNGDADPVDGRPVICFAAGVGVTLALSLLRGTPPGNVLHIDYSAAVRGDMAYADRIEQAANGDTISCRLRTDDVDGFIDNQSIADAVSRHPGARIYICGPEGYTRRIAAGLRKAGVAERNIRIEAFFLTKKTRPKPSLRKLAYAAGLMIAFLPLLLLAPALADFVPNEHHTPGHEKLACADCHQAAPGSMRQQLQAKAKHLLGMRAADADFGNRAVDNATCIGCHENPDDRHPAHRFLEPRFELARRTLAPQTCVSCHREHTDTRLSQTDSGFCASCHSDMKPKDDPTRPTHVALVKGDRWDTCLQCHDFHGNHGHVPPTDLKDALAPGVVADYLRRARSPYGERVIKARQPETQQ